MSRRAQAPTRAVLPDPKFGSQVLAKFMNMVMEDGKKSAAERILYGAIDRISEKTGRQGDAALRDLQGRPGRGDGRPHRFRRGLGPEFCRAVARELADGPINRMDEHSGLL